MDHRESVRRFPSHRHAKSMSVSALITTVVPVAVGALLLFSAAKKLAAQGSVTRMIVGLGVSQLFAGMATAALIGVELAGGLAAFLPGWHVMAGGLTVALGTSFGLAGVHAVLNRGGVQCACFGGAARPLGFQQTAWIPAFWLAGFIQITTTARWSNLDGVVVAAASLTGLSLVIASSAVYSVKMGSEDRIATTQTSSIYA